LEEMGWKVVVIWECQTKDEVRLQEQIDSIFS
jgi:G:T-mismatch repair DNA endonuclease (very short patch repair protein)